MTQQKLIVVPEVLSPRMKRARWRQERIRWLVDEIDRLNERGTGSLEDELRRLEEEEDEDGMEEDAS
jgi:hypothetical protein